MGCPIVNETARLSQAQQTAPFETIDSVDFLKNTALDIPTFIALLFFSNSLKLPGLLETSRNSGELAEHIAELRNWFGMR